MSETLLTIEPQPYSASSVYYALNKAPESAYQSLLGLYALHRKWREAANYADNHQAVTTLNWWHHELEAEPAKAIEHPALRALYAALREAGHTVYVVAPMTQQSGVGHSLTVFEPVRATVIEEPGFTGTGVFGTPTDCVKLALGRLLPQRPDLVMSGINAGANVGPDILYSGTVGAATEAAHEELPSMAVSHDSFSHNTGPQLSQ